MIPRATPVDPRHRQLPALATRGRSIVCADTGSPVRLRGVNLSSLEYSEPRGAGFLAASGITREEVMHLTRGLGANILRIPFNQDWVLRGRGEATAGDYLAALDQVIGWAEEGGAYALLDLHWLDADTERGGPRQFVAPLPNAQSIVAWSTVAGRYRDRPNVLFDLFNEPHDRLRGDPIPLGHPDGSAYRLRWRRRVYAHNWKPWALRLIDGIREMHPSSLIFVSGVNWGYDLRGMEMDRENLVYSTHVYRERRPNWESAFGRLADTMPVFAGEFGGRDSDLEWGRQLLRYLDDKGLGWTAWSWRDQPHLQRGGELTAFGALVAQSLRAEQAARGKLFATYGLEGGLAAGTG